MPLSTPGSVADSAVSFSDITTNNVSTSKHGFAPKAPNDATRYLDGTGAYSVPTGASSDGWTSDIATTWTYASSTTFTVAGVDVTAKFSKGTRLRLKQGGAYKYFVVSASSFSTDTTVTITGGNDYSLANAAITDNYYSYAVNPQGYPGSFNYTPVWSSTGTQPNIGNGTILGIFTFTGSTLSFSIDIVLGSTSTFGTGAYRYSLPTGFTAVRRSPLAVLGVNSGVAYRPAVGMVDAGASSANAVNPSNFSEWGPTVPHTWTATDIMALAGSIEI